MTLFRRVHLGALWNDRVRSLFAVVGITTGVSVVVGITMLNLQIGRAFDGLAPRIAAQGGSVLQVTPVVQGRLPEAVFDDVARVAGSRSTIPMVSDLTPLVAGSRTAGVLLVGADCRLELLVGDVDCARLRRRPPAPGPGTPVALTPEAAAALGVEAGDPLALPGGAAGAARVGWIMRHDRRLSAVNRGFVALADSIPAAQDLLGRPGYLTDVFVVTRSAGVESRLARVLGGVATVGQPRGRMPPALVTVRQAISSMSLVGLLIGILIAVNTVALALAHRRSTLGTLSALGATGRRVFAGFLGEGAILGVLGGALAVVPGYLLGAFLLHSYGDSLLAGTGARLDAAFDPAVVGTGLAAGITAGLLAVAVPALGVLRAGPLAAMGGVTVTPPGRRLPLWLVPAGVAVAAAGLLTAARFGEGRAPQMAGTLSLSTGMFGIVLVAFAIVPPGASALAGLAGRFWPAVGRLVRADVDRLPLWIAATAATLAIGVGFAAGFSSLGTLGGRTAEGLFERALAGAVLVSPQGPWDQAEGHVSDAVSRRASRALPSARTAARLRAIIPGASPRVVIGVAPGSWLARRHVRVPGGADGVFARVRRGGVALSDVAAGRLGADAGDTVTLTTVAGPRRFRVAGVFTPGFVDDSTIGDWVVVSEDAAAEHWAATREQVAFLPEGDGDAAGAAAARLSAVVGTARVYDGAAWRRAVRPGWGRFFRPFTITGYLLMLAAGLAVANLLLLGLVQRRRERAGLRAIGMEPGTERAVLVVETAAMTVLGVVVGLGATLLFSWLLALSSPVFYGFRLDWGVVPGALALGVGAAVVVAAAGLAWPLVAAGRLSVVEELRGE